MPAQTDNLEINMYIGGGLLGLILVVALILFVLRRA
jgi:O-antigen ligase